jgi:hypothetical protein
MKFSRLVAIDDIEIEGRAGLEKELRWFYGDVGQLEEVKHLRGNGSELRFRSAGIELRVRIREQPRTDPVRRRLTLLVPSIRTAALQLRERLAKYRLLSGWNFTDRRLATWDPAGNRVELKQEWPYAPL